MRLVNYALLSAFTMVTMLPGIAVADTTDADTTDAVTCNALAPGLTAQQLADRSGAYYELEAIELDHATSSNVNQLRKMFSGRWNGTMSIETCTGHFTAPVMKQKIEYRLNAEAETTYKGDIRVEAIADSHRSTRVAKLFISPGNSYSVEQVDNRTWVFTEKYRARSLANTGFPQTRLPPSLTGHTARLVHEVKKVQLDQGRITVDHTVYVSGFLVSRGDWILTRG